MLKTTNILGKTRKIVVLTPKSEFSRAQIIKLSKLGKVVYTDSRRQYPMSELLDLVRDADLLALDPDNLGGFEVANEKLIKLLDSAPSIKHLALSTTSYGYINQEYCQKMGIHVSNVPHYSSESVAEHAIALLLGLSKRLFLSDRLTQKGEYHLEKGHEIAGKTLGIIGLGNIGKVTAKLALGLGMHVIAYNRSPKQVAGVKQCSLDQVLSESDYLSLHLIDCRETEGILSKERINKLKRGVMLVNTASRELVDEKALASALKSGHVDSYALEAEDLSSPPLGGLENAFLLKDLAGIQKKLSKGTKRSG